MSNRSSSRFRSPWWTAALVLLLPFAAACGGSSGDQAEQAAPQGETPPAVETDASSAAVVMPNPVNRVDPAYPEAARAAGTTGTVFVQVWVDAAGAVVNAEPTMPDAQAGSTDSLLVDAALTAARQWTFEPREAGADTITMVIPFAFKLDGDGEKH